MKCYSFEFPIANCQSTIENPCDPPCKDFFLKRINKVAILGAGTMGARIAAHFANAGVPSYLLDIVPSDADVPGRNKIAAAGLEAAKKSKPAAFFEPSLAGLVKVGNFEDDFKRVGEVDWIIEAVVENLDIKRALMKRVDARRKPGTIITTNPSGLPVAKIAEGFSDDFRRCWFGTHFFNPPRYMRLLEIIPTPETDRTVLDAVTWFSDVRLGKGVVVAKDTPNFIANRIGTFSVLNVMRLMQEMNLTIEEVDALTGQAVGWPKSATFRTIDLVGLDILGHVVANMTTPDVGASVSPVQLDERSDLKLPDFYKQMLERKWLGDKTKAGFYKKVKAAEGQEDERLAVDWKTLEYHPRQKPKFPLLDMAKNVEETGARLRMLLGLEGVGPQKGDKAGAFLWSALSDLWTYSANPVAEISYSLVDLGDGIGCIEFHSKMNSIGSDIVQLISQSLKPGGPGDNFDAFVITNDAANFSVGANLMLLLMSIQEEEWDEVDLAIRTFQGMTEAIKFSPKPVVVAPFGLTLGGGTEISLHAPALQPHAELYMGLVEVGVGLLPGAGGCKEMLLRAVDSAQAIRAGGRGESVELMEAMKKAFETIATAKVATSAHEARSLGFLRNSDSITMNRERVLADAKARALELERGGYEPAVPRTDIPAPGENILAALKLGVHLMRQGDYITEYEVKLATKIAEVLCGGKLTAGTPISQHYVTDLEREGFKSLCGEKKTQERIQYTLKTGKTLRN